MNFPYIPEDRLCFCTMVFDESIGGACNTAEYLRATFPRIKRFAIVPSTMHPDNVSVVYKKYNKVFYGGKTIASMINSAMNESDKENVFIITAGSRPKYKEVLKYFYFYKEDTDVLYPVINRKIPFPVASLNGILVSKKNFKRVGNLEESLSSLTEVKTDWAARAVYEGLTFKAIVGSNFL